LLLCQSNLLNGIQTFKLAESDKYNRLPQKKKLMIIQHQAMDESVIIEFVQEVVEKKQDKINFSLLRIRPELANVLTTWLASHPLENPNAVVHPMAMKEYQALFEKYRTDVNNSLKQAELRYNEAQQANTNSDRYSLFTVVFSMVMFLGAIARVGK
jgi:hypothetical protein